MAGIGQDLKKIYSDETRIVENASLCTVMQDVDTFRQHKDVNQTDIQTDYNHLAYFTIWSTSLCGSYMIKKCRNIIVSF